MTNKTNDIRLIEAGFPCHQVGAETQRERGASSALPPLYYLHVWWARRPLTPSRAAILGSLLPAVTDSDWFLRQLGIEKVQAEVNGEPWTLEDKLISRINQDSLGVEVLLVDDVVLRAIDKEMISRAQQRKLIKELIKKNPLLEQSQAIIKWQSLSKPFPEPVPVVGDALTITRAAADPAWFQEVMRISSEEGFRVPNLYGYSRAYSYHPQMQKKQITILDPTSGGGSIPFEALRLGYKVISNDLNPVASVIQYATLRYPAYFGRNLSAEIEKWGNQLLSAASLQLDSFFPREFRLPEDEKAKLIPIADEILIDEFDRESTTTYLYCRQVTCPHCGGEAPLINSCWLSKSGEKWGINIVPDGSKRGGTVSFKPYRLTGKLGPNGEDPDFATVNGGVGTCIHCRQAISGDEIKAQARGESPHGNWKDRLYCVVAVRFQPKLDKAGLPQRYSSGEKSGDIKTEKVSFFRAPNQQDLQALLDSERRLLEKWDEWERQGLIPTEQFPKGNDMRPTLYGMSRWCDMFTPRQLLGHLTLIEELNRLKPVIISELGPKRGRAVVTYLQFMIDKGLDYNSRQTRWEYTRGIVKGTFGRHDYSLKWTFGEMVFSGPNSGAAWGLSQILDAYSGMAELVAPLSSQLKGAEPPVEILHGSAANLNVADNSVDLICIDPPYYNNVQYAELSDYFYVWQKRTLSDLYPEIFLRRLTNKTDEAVANPARDGSAAKAKAEYERLMGEIFAECKRVLNDNGIMTVMFTHKTREAWEALTRSLIENGWNITSSMPVESESSESTHQKDMAAAASSIFITCRKREKNNGIPATWTGFGGTGVSQRIRQAVREGLKEFEPLQLNPVDEMVASYGRALQVLSENWPVVDGEETVSPIRAMNEASAVVAQYQISRLTQGRISVDDLNPEAAMSLTLFGIFGLSNFPYDDALNLSRSLNVNLDTRTGGYTVSGRMIGINTESRGARSSRSSEAIGYQAPLLRKGSKLRLALPEERDTRRIERPQTEWDVLQGVILSYREGDVPVARAYLTQHAEGREHIIIDLLSVWAAEVTSAELRKEAQAILYSLK